MYMNYIQTHLIFLKSCMKHYLQMLPTGILEGKGKRESMNLVCALSFFTSFPQILMRQGKMNIRVILIELLLE